MRILFVWFIELIKLPEGGDFILSMLNVLFVIKWCVCTTMELVVDICSRTLVHARVLYTMDLVTAPTILRTSGVSARAPWPSLILILTKLSNSNCRSPFSPSVHELLAVIGSVLSALYALLRT
jgi:hypothetical protein